MYYAGIRNTRSFFGAVMGRNWRTYWKIFAWKIFWHFSCFIFHLNPLLSVFLTILTILIQLIFISYWSIMRFHQTLFIQHFKIFAKEDGESFFSIMRFFLHFSLYSWQTSFFREIHNKLRRIWKEENWLWNQRMVFLFWRRI